MKLPLDSDLLRTFLAVAESENFTKAGKAVARTQSAISMQMKRLETIVGEPVFERGQRGVQLTSVGERLLPNARRIVSMLDDTTAMLNARPFRGPVRIGIPEEYGYSVLTGALGAFAKRHPKADVTVRFGPSSEQIEALHAGKLDLAVVFEWRRFSGAEVLKADPTVWVTSILHHMHEETPLPIAIYENSAWCREFAIRSIEQRGLDFRVAYTSQNSGGLKLAVASGLAIAPLSRSNIPADCRELGVADGFGDIDDSRVVLHTNPNTSSETIDGMAAAIREAFR